MTANFSCKGTECKLFVAFSDDAIKYENEVSDRVNLLSPEDGSRIVRARCEQTGQSLEALGCGDVARMRAIGKMFAAEQELRNA